MFYGIFLQDIISEAQSYFIKKKKMVISKTHSLHYSMMSFSYGGIAQLVEQYK